MNNAYPRGASGRRFKAFWAASYQENIIEGCRGIDNSLERGGLPKDCPTYYVSFLFILPDSEFYTKAGDIKAKDTSNYIKLTEDAFFRYLQELDPKMDDKYFISLGAHKRPCSQYAIDGEYTVTIYISPDPVQEYPTHLDEIIAPHIW